MALALPFLRIDKLAMVMPTRSDSSVTLIFRFASITSILIIIAMVNPFKLSGRFQTLYRQHFEATSVAEQLLKRL